jgi:biotin operon repressor
MEPGDVYKVSLPRSDLKVTADGVEVKAAFALGSWLAFKKAGEHTIVMGDLVLTRDEVNPVISKLEEGGIQVTALHHHLNNFKPDILFMHVGGEGDPGKLAEALHAGLAMSKTPLGKASAKATAEKLPLDTAELDRIIGREGKASGGVYHFTVARAEEVKEAGMAIPPAMGTATAINFQPTGDEKAAITGDFVMTVNEVNPVIRALQEQGIQVTALHNHMLEEEPRLFFMHFWANDDAQKLAHGLRAALDQMDLAKG